MGHHGLHVPITDCIVSSTVPRVVFNLRVLCDRYFDTRPLVVGKPECLLPTQPRVDRGTQVGPDRLVNTAGAFDRHGGDLIVVDFGTATTFDVVAHDGAYVGGVIAPGVNLSLEALHHAAAALPHVDVTKPQKVIGTNTVGMHAVRRLSGATWVWCAASATASGANMTGACRSSEPAALASLFSQGDVLFDRIEDDLTMHGLTVIYNHNKDQGAIMTDRNRLIYLPLGGAGEIGMNCYVYGYGDKGAERLIVVDTGVAFPDMDGQPGVDLILPDIDWLAERADRIEGIFITHAHEDHVGGLGHLWSRLRAPVYARAFTAIHARRKMEEVGQDPEQVRVVEAYPAVVEAGPFRVQFAPVSHSIPEAAALVIDTPGGRVVHSGDFKIDRDPVVGEAFDEEMFRDIAGRGVKAFICDSTNVFSRHPGRSESQLPEPIGKLIADARGMVVATTFASNVARLKTLADAGVAQGRSICLLGRAMKRMVTAAVEAGVLTDFPRTLSPEEATEVPRDSLMLIVTGSQGERRAASAALSRGSYLGHELKEGDLFLFFPPRRSPATRSGSRASRTRWPKRAC